MRAMKATYVAAAVFAIVYIALDLNKLYALRYGADLGTFLQTIVNMWHGSSWNFGEWRSHLLVHDSWILFAIVPIVHLFPRAETLIVIQVAVVGAAAIPLASLGRIVGLSPRAANVVAISYLLSPSAQGFSYDNFSENVFVPLLAFLLAIACYRKNLIMTLAVAQLLMGTKEDQILFVAWLAAVCFLFWDRRLGGAVFGLAVLNVFAFWGIEHILSNHANVPQYALVVGDVSGKISMVLLLLLPFAFAPLVVWRWLWLALPMLCEIVFLQKGAYEPSRIGTHYTASLLSLAAIAAVIGVRSLPRFAAFMIPCALVSMLFNDTALRPGRWPYVVDWSAYSRAAALRDSGWEVLLPRRYEGVWAVAAANPNVRLDQHSDPHFVACPAYNTDARAFFASLVGHMPLHVCGGVPLHQ
jgi:uncharacterized membrane protein